MIFIAVFFILIPTTSNSKQVWQKNLGFCKTTAFYLLSLQIMQSQFMNTTNRNMSINCEAVNFTFLYLAPITYLNIREQKICYS